MLTTENIKDTTLYQAFTCMSLYSELRNAQQQVAQLERDNKALMEKVADLDKRLAEPPVPVPTSAPYLQAVEAMERAKYRDEYLPIGEATESLPS